MSIAKYYLFSNILSVVFHAFAVSYMVFSIRITYSPDIIDVLFYSLFCNIVNFLLFIYFSVNRKQGRKENWINFSIFSMIVVFIYTLVGVSIILTI